MGFFTQKITERAHPSANINWSEYFGGGSRSAAGSLVTESSVMGLPAVWAGVNFISTTKAGLPLHVFKRTRAGSEIATGHPVDKILSSRANKWQDSFKFVETLCNYEILSGFAYCEKLFDSHGRIVGLLPIPTWRVRGPLEIEGSWFYEITNKEGGKKFLEEFQVLKIEGPYGGSSILKLMVESFGLSISIDQFASNFFARGANPGLVVRHPKTLNPDGHKKLQNALGSKYSGLGNAFRLMLLDEGMEAQKLLHSLEENQLVGLKQFQIADVARILNLPPHILKDLSKSSFSNIEKQSIELVIYSLLPRVKRYESVFNTFLLKEADQGKFFVKFNLKGLLRGDDAARADFYTKMRRLGVFNVNDILALEDMNSIGSKGDIYHISADLIPLESAGIEAKKALEDFKDHIDPAKTHTRAAEHISDEPKSVQQIATQRQGKMSEYEPIFREAIQKLVNVETSAIRKKVKLLEDGDAKGFEKWLRSFYESFPDTVSQKTDITFKAYANSVKEMVLAEIGEEISEDFEDDLTEYMDGFSRQYIDGSIGQMIVLIGEENAHESVSERLDGWHESKASKEAERQTTSLMGAVSISVILGAGYKAIWKNTGSKSCPYCKKLHNKVVGRKGQTFAKKNQKIDGDDTHGKLIVPHPIKYPSLHRGCKCIVIKQAA